MVNNNKDSDLSKTQALLCIPEKNRCVEETLLKSGDLILSYESAYKPIFSKIQRLFSKSPKKTFRRKIQLDGLGLDVWELIDGVKDVKTIINKFSVRHHLNQKESEISVAQFLRSLGEKGLIGIKEPKN